MTKNVERQERIELYGKAYQLLIKALEKFPREMWRFRPAPDRWTIHEIVIHLADSEANGFVRVRKLVAEPGATITAYDEPAWARALDYNAQSVEDALELFRWLRGNTDKLIRTLAESVWANTIYHPENGTMTMDDWLLEYARHIPDHIAQMEEVYADWMKQK